MRRIAKMVGIVIGVVVLICLANDLYYYFVLNACPLWWGDVIQVFR